MTKLNEYLQAEKANSINVETLFGDLQKRCVHPVPYG